MQNIIFSFKGFNLEVKPTLILINIVVQFFVAVSHLWLSRYNPSVGSKQHKPPVSKFAVCIGQLTMYFGILQYSNVSILWISILRINSILRIFFRETIFLLHKMFQFYVLWACHSFKFTYFFLEKHLFMKKIEPKSRPKEVKKWQKS